MKNPPIEREGIKVILDKLMRWDMPFGRQESGLPKPYVDAFVASDVYEALGIEHKIPAQTMLEIANKLISPP